MKDPRLEKHLVVHDTLTMALAGISGALGTLVTGSLDVGALMMAAVFALGVAAMRVAPFRRGVNRLALAALRAAK
ncbi:hypothetical protein [Streptomyces cucumeris]|uniref:hypothetical protein n=1 Tax=Streptomyces cucumeris TaxID=2962890 RepID=UPI0020C892AB|nr:hypothetical protein [Streptomyces sp. NEAU-Y11]MCP9209662.1 hypothetical protein [Streptomyces sp. NEAU-Y11]